MPRPPMRMRSPFFRCFVTRATRSARIASACFFAISWSSASCAPRCFKVIVVAGFADFATAMFPLSPLIGCAHSGRANPSQWCRPHFDGMRDRSSRSKGIRRSKRLKSDFSTGSQQEGQAMAKLRHIAIIVPDPEKAAQFFEQAFDMKRAGKARRGIYVSDGTVNVALLKIESEQEKL